MGVGGAVLCSFLLMDARAIHRLGQKSISPRCPEHSSMSGAAEDSRERLDPLAGFSRGVRKLLPGALLCIGVSGAAILIERLEVPALGRAWLEAPPRGALHPQVWDGLAGP
jgi:hypothetical protein